MPVKPAILFVFPDYARNYFSSHLGTAYIISYLRQEGIYAKQFCYYKPANITEITGRILNYNPSIVGFTCYNTNYFLIKLLSKELKKHRPGILIIAGGPTPTFSDMIVLHNIPEIDICVRGDGEYTAKEIIEHFKTGRKFDNITGITYRSNNNIIRAQDRPLINSSQHPDSGLDILPSPYLSNVLSPLELTRHKNEIPLIASRGCIFKCTYCNCTAISKHTIRYHSPERVAAELEIIHSALKEKQAQTIRIYDDCFTLNNSRIEQICNYIIKKKLSLNIAISTRADYVNEKILRLLYEAGVRNISFGIESANPKTLYRIKKIRLFYKKIDGFRPEKKFLAKLKRAVALAKKIGFETEASIILGLPREGIKDILRTLDFAKHLGLRFCYCNYLSIYPGTELFKTFERGKLKTSEKWLRIPWDAMPENMPRHKLFSIPILTNSNIAAKKRTDAFLCSAFLMGFLNKRGFAQALFFLENTIPLYILQNKLRIQSLLLFAQHTNKQPVQESRKIKIRCIRLAQALSMRCQNNCIDYKTLEKYYTHNGTAMRIINISSASDIAKFEKLLLKMPELAYSIFSNKINPFTLVDACRWSHNCPAKNLSRLIVDKKLRISTCFHGKIIGKLGEPVEKIKKRCAGYMQSEREKRSCEKCPAKRHCSQCAFLGNIPYEAYCGIRRKYPALIDKFIGFLKLKNTIDAQAQYNLPNSL
ncbi:MAG: radical SAM protein [Candidatus Omnitrophota bacterium]|nr:radical SAM protein [Candidatus Omnitrophota bacterium]